MMLGDTVCCWVAGTAPLFPTSLPAVGRQRDGEADYRREQAEGHCEAGGVSPQPCARMCPGSSPPVPYLWPFASPHPVSSAQTPQPCPGSWLCPLPWHWPCSAGSPALPWGSAPPSPRVGGQSLAPRLTLTLLSPSRLSVAQVASHVGPVEVSGRAPGSPGLRTAPAAGAGGRAGSGGAADPLQGPPSWAHGLPVPQVKKLENILKFGLWLFGVPWANSECCPSAVSVTPPPWLPPLTPCSPHRAAPGWIPPAHPARLQPARPPALAAGGGSCHLPSPR